jgi:hypothetical protein
MTPSAAGKLSATPLAHGLVYARNRRLTGRLQLAAGDQHAAIMLWRGNITAIETRPLGMTPGGYFGTVVHDLGMVDASMLDASLLELAASNQLHGEILVEKKIITEAQRDEALVEQIHRKVHHLFTLPETTSYSFFDMQPAASTVNVDPVGPIWRGIRDYPPVKFIRETLARIGDGKLRRTDTSVKLPAVESDLLSLLDQRSMSVSELKGVGTLPAEQVESLVYLLVIARCLESGTSTHFSAGPLPTSMPSGPMPRVTPPQIHIRTPSKSDAEPVKTPEAVHTPADLGVSAIVARAAAVEQEGYFTVLGVADGASAEAVRAAYMRLSKTWHPDRLGPELADVKTEIGKIFSHMTRAQRTLCDVETRRTYLREQAKTRPRDDVMLEIEQAQSTQDVDVVVRHCQELLDSDADDAEALAIQAWAAARWGQATDDEVRIALAKLDRAVNVDRTNVSAVFHRGLAYKRLDNVPAAFRDFSRALQLDPTHAGAEREVRIFAMRARKGSGEHKLGLRRR